MRPIFFLREALRGLRRSSAPALAALLTILLTALVLGVFIAIVQATTGTANEVRNRVAVDVYVSDSATDEETADPRRSLAPTRNVESVEFISKDEALARAEKTLAPTGGRGSRPSTRSATARRRRTRSCPPPGS